MNLEILYEDDNFLAINKPAGLLVHGVKGKYAKSEPDLVDWIVANRPEIRNVGDVQPHTGQPAGDRPGIVHRLDRQTSGVMLVAKNQKYFEYLKDLFQTKGIKKTYVAVVHGRLEGDGKVDKPIGLKDGSIKRTVHVTPKTKMVREAVTLYKALKHAPSVAEIKEGKGEFTLVEVKPLTGRTHQIRVHMNSIGHPVVGDELYGKKVDGRRPGNTEHSSANVKAPRHFLHAESIEFSTESGKRIKISAPMPEEFKSLIDKGANG